MPAGIKQNDLNLLQMLKIRFGASGTKKYHKSADLLQESLLPSWHDSFQVMYK